MNTLKKERFFWMVFGLIMVLLIAVIYLLEVVLK